MGANTSELVGAAATVVITALVEFFFWKWIRRNQSIFHQIKEAEQMRYGFMKTGVTKSFNYACVEGVVSADDKDLRSGQEMKTILLKTLTVKEMLWLTFWRGVTGGWLDVTDNFETVHFHLLVKEKRDDKPIKVFITDPSKAAFPMPGLSLLVGTGRQRAPLSLVLPAQTTLTGFGKLTLADNGKITMEPPASSEGCYTLTAMTRGELLGTTEEKIWRLKCLAFAIFLIGEGITVYMIYSHIRRQKPNWQPRKIAVSLAALSLVATSLAALALQKL